MSSKKYYLSVMAVFKNEAHILQEWIEHYLVRGFSHIFLINDGSTDNYQSILSSYSSNFITLFQNDVVMEKLGRQKAIYTKYAPQALESSTWLAILDLDEFLWSPLLGSKLKSFFVDCQLQKIIQVHVDWQHFGSNFFVSQPKNVVTSFVRRANNSEFHKKSYYGVKSIVFCDAVNQLHIHKHHMKMDQGKSIHVGWSQKNEILLINHYAIQSLEFWLEIKAKRGDVNRYISTMARNLDVFQSQNHNDVEDLRLAQQFTFLKKKSAK